MNLIELANVSAHIGSQSVLQNVFLNIATNERLAIMGPSGAGKSSLLRVIAGLQTIQTGEVRWEGQPIVSDRTFQRSVAMLTQDYALYPQLTVQGNLQASVQSSLQAQTLPKDELLQRCERVIEWFEIGALLKRLPSEISGGQAQRVAFAKALVRQPKLLLLDEPLSQLDNSLRRNLLSKLVTACDNDRIAVCYVTHDLREAFQVASRIVVLNSGCVVQDGPSIDIYRSPNSMLVADVCSYWPLNYLPLVNPEFANLRAFAPANAKVAGIRAEQIEIANESQTSDQIDKLSWPNWSMKVATIEHLGFTHCLHGQVGAIQVQAVAACEAVDLGQTVKIAVKPTNILWF